MSLLHTYSSITSMYLFMSSEICMAASSSSISLRLKFERKKKSSKQNFLNTDMCWSNSYIGADCRESILMSFAPPGEQAINFPCPELISAKSACTKE